MGEGGIQVSIQGLFPGPSLPTCQRSACQHVTRIRSRHESTVETSNVQVLQKNEQLASECGTLDEEKPGIPSPSLAPRSSPMANLTLLHQESSAPIHIHIDRQNNQHFRPPPQPSHCSRPLRQKASRRLSLTICCGLHWPFWGWPFWFRQAPSHWMPPKSGGLQTKRPSASAWLL